MQVKYTVLYTCECLTSVRISAMFENIRDPPAARWNRIHELTSKLKMCRTTIFHSNTLGMVWYKLTNRYRGSVFMARIFIHFHKLLSSQIRLLCFSRLIVLDSYIRHICGLSFYYTVLLNQSAYRNRRLVLGRYYDISSYKITYSIQLCCRVAIIYTHLITLGFKLTNITCS